MRGIGLTVHSPKIESVQSTEDIKDSLNVLKKIQKLSSKLDQSTSDSNLSDILTEIQTLSSKSLKTTYPSNFIPNEDYLKTMPDIQNGSASLIRGSKQRIQHVGISNFRLPVSFKTKNLSSISLETSVTGSVSLEANKKGVNMSRIMRSFYKTSEETFSFDVITKAISLYKKDLDSFDARIQMKFSFPIKFSEVNSVIEVNLRSLIIDTFSNS